MPFGRDISLTYLCDIYEWELGSGVGGGRGGGAVQWCFEFAWSDTHKLTQLTCNKTTSDVNYTQYKDRDTDLKTVEHKMIQNAKV